MSDERRREEFEIGAHCHPSANPTVHPLALQRLKASRRSVALLILFRDSLLNLALIRVPGERVIKLQSKLELPAKAPFELLVLCFEAIAACLQNVARHLFNEARQMVLCNVHIKIGTAK